MAVTPFQIAVPDAELDALHAAIAPAPGGPTRSTDAGWDYGTPLGYLQELVAYWADGFRLARARAVAQLAARNSALRSTRRVRATSVCTSCTNRASDRHRCRSS